MSDVHNTQKIITLNQGEQYKEITQEDHSGMENKLQRDKK